MKKQKYITLWVSLMCIIIFVIQLIIPRFTDIFALSSNALIQPWQFLTAIFLHGSIVHLLYNLFALLMFGLILEGLIGSKNFLILFLISGIAANLIAFNFYPSSLGASGAIMGIVGCLAILKPMMTVWAFNLPMPMFVLAIIWVTGSIMGIFGLGDPNTGHIAHLSGIIFGIVYGIYLRFTSKKHLPPKEKVEIDEDSIRSWEDSYID